MALDHYLVILTRQICRVWRVESQCETAISTLSSHCGSEIKMNTKRNHTTTSTRAASHQVGAPMQTQSGDGSFALALNPPQSTDPYSEDN